MQNDDSIQSMTKMRWLLSDKILMHKSGNPIEAFESIMGALHEGCNDESKCAYHNVFEAVLENKLYNDNAGYAINAN